jgi:hypothetical protein
MSPPHGGKTMKTLVLIITLLVISGCSGSFDDPNHPYHNVGKRSSYTKEDYYWEGYDEGVAAAKKEGKRNRLIYGYDKYPY